MKLKHLRRRLRAPFFAWKVRRSAVRGLTDADLQGARVSVALVTYQRRRFLELCLEALLGATASFPGQVEVIVWNNGSQDGTRELLDQVAARDPRVVPLHHERNIGVNGYKRAFDRATGDYLLELDDDVLWFPPRFLEQLVLALKKVPRLGYLSADVVQDEFTTGSRFTPDHYVPVAIDAETTVEFGSTGGWCSITPRAAFEAVGGFREDPEKFFWNEDGDFQRRLRKAGWERGILHGVRVYHASGPWCNVDYRPVYDAKLRDIGALEVEARKKSGLSDLPAPPLPFLETFLARYRPDRAGGPAAAPAAT